jgi:hypothetical protein
LKLPIRFKKIGFPFHVFVALAHFVSVKLRCPVFFKLKKRFCPSSPFKGIVRHGVFSALREGIAPYYAENSKNSAGDYSPFSHGVDGVLRAGGSKAAGGRGF